MKKIIQLLLFRTSYLRFIKTKQQSSLFNYLLFLFGLKRVYWPHDKNCVIANPTKIFVGINSYIGRPGCYYQGAGGLYIGKYVRIATNTGVMTANHDLLDHNKSIYNSVVIGDYTWVGMNCVILPGVVLGTRTIVAAGSVVTKSFPDGFCVIGGNPAKSIKTLDKDQFHPWKFEEEYYGYVNGSEFESVSSKYLDKEFLKSISGKFSI